MQTVDPTEVDPAVLAAALQAIRPKLTSAQLMQLEEHYTAPRQVIVNDRKGHLSPIIMYYGKIGGALSRHLHLRPGKYQFRWLMTDRPTKDGSNFEWHLHPNVIQAIALLKWFAGPA
ncbi:MAG: hypothetical protein KGI90_06330, partial [Burkholderiales bacterium]|nr:hypothetical protein [Burkholderiales bacterium]